jgi:RNA polymerase sigma factor (sigma-70 family)
MAGLTDAQLLERFTSGHDEPAELAFAALVERHGPMVLRVCQSVLKERHDAEDAFQASFLVLVRGAASIRNQSSIVSWLHGVAFRVASCQKGAAARRRRHERTVAERAVLSIEQAPRDDVSLVIHQELDRLPEKYRAPIVLCYFESLSHEQAAAQLGWPVGTVRSRLARGRDQLRGRLERRGLALSIILLERALCGETAEAAIPLALAHATVGAAVQYASGRFVATCVTSTSVALLAEGAMNVMFLSKVKSLVLAGGLIATGALVVAQQAGTMGPVAKPPAASHGEAEDRLAQSEAIDEDAADARELGRLDLDLLAEDVRQLREQVEVALRDKLRAERKNSAQARDAQTAFETARATYLAKARELRTAQSRLASAKEPREAGPERSAALSKPADDRAIPSSSANEPGAHPSAAVIGSIDTDAVFSRYEKVKVFKKEYSAALLARKNELMKIMSEAQEESQILQKLARGSEDYLARGSEEYRNHERRLTDLRARHDVGREQSEREFAERQAEATAAFYQEIQEAVADLAKAKGLTYVVRVSPRPLRNSLPSEVETAVKSSVV